MSAFDGCPCAVWCRLHKWVSSLSLRMRFQCWKVGGFDSWECCSRLLGQTIATRSLWNACKYCFSSCVMQCSEVHQPLLPHSG